MKPNILFLLIDSLRADKCHGDKKIYYTEQRQNKQHLTSLNLKENSGQPPWRGPVDILCNRIGMLPSDLFFSLDQPLAHCSGGGESLHHIKYLKEVALP